VVFAILLTAASVLEVRQLQLRSEFAPPASARALG